MAVEHHDLPLAPHRVRHIVSLHLRNFSPQGTASSSSHQLHAISLGIAASQDAQPVYLTDVSEPAVHVNWIVDAKSIASSSQAQGSSRGIVGQDTFAISAWAKETGELAAELADGHDEPVWKYCWQKPVDMSSLQLISGGLTSPHLRRLPPNSLILGLQTQTVRSARHHHSITSDTQQVAKDVAAGEANPSIQVRYYLVVQSHASRRRRSTLRSKAKNRLNEQASIEIQDDDRGIASEHSGNESEDSDDDRAQGITGYDSETAHELSHKNRAGSPIHGDTNRRPTLDRRRSSNRALRAIKQDRSRRRSASRSQSNASATETQPPSRSQTHAQWLLDREREKEVLERSKWETTMLASYSREALHDIVDLQLQVSTESRAFNEDKAENSRKLQDTKSVFAQARDRSSLQGQLTQLETLKESQDGHLRTLRSKIAERKEDLARRRARLDFVRRELTQQQQQLHNPPPSSSTDELESLHVSIHNRRAHLLETLSFIFPIRLVSASDLLFSIAGQALPNSPDSALLDKNPFDEEVIAAALGFTAQVVLLLSSYLETSLHYDVATAGSRAMIRDGISIMNGPRSFPLYSKGAEMYRFEYAVFLLNKNIEQLMNVHNLPVLDLRHILPNLNSLILTLSSTLSHHQLQAPSTSAKTKKRQSSTIGATTSPNLHINTTRSSQLSRKGYKMIGKGEIILPSSKKSQAEEETKNNSVDQASTETAPGVPPAAPSAALSWTASLFGRSSRTASSSSTVGGGGSGDGKNGPESRTLGSDNQAQTPTQAQTG